MRKKLIAVVGAGLLLTGCASTPEPAPTVTVVQTVAPEPEETAEPAVDTSGPLALGENVDFGGYSFTVYAVNLDPAPEPAPQPERAEDKWASADVEYCTDADTTITTHWWRIVAADNRQYQPSSTGYDAFPEPAYAWGEVPVAAGTCQRGWITFVVGKEADPKTIRYANDKGNAADWAIS